MTGSMSVTSSGARDALVRGKSQAAPAKLRLLTVPEACELLRVSRWTLNRLIQTQELKTIKIRGRRLIRLEAIQKLVDSLEDSAGYE